MARIIETGLGNLVIRKLLKFTTKRIGNERRLDKILKSYALNEDVKSNLQIGYWRKGLVSTLEGIAWRGPEKPFTSYAPFMVVWNFTNACNLKCKHFIRALETNQLLMN